MKILITGSNGLLGQKLVYLLRTNADVELIATARGANRLHSKSGYRYIELDLTDKNRVQEVVEQQNPDVLIHCAAMTQLDDCELNQEEAYKINVLGTQYLVDACSKLDMHFIYVSTDFVFDGIRGMYKETDATNPISYYAKTKLEGEEYVQAHCPKWSIVRTVLVYGVTDGMSRSNIVLWAKKALEKGDPIKVVNDQYRTPTLAEDLAQGCWLVADKEATGIFHVSGKDYFSILEIVEEVAVFYKLSTDCITPMSSKELNQPATRPAITGFVIDKAVKELGYAPHSFKEGIEILDHQMNEMLLRDQ